MDFHALVEKLKQLDNQPKEVSTQENCGMPAPNPLPPPVKPDIPPPSLNVNLSAQGMENIEQMMQLFKKVNPDMMPKIEPMPMLSPEPSIMNIKPPMSGIGDLGNLDTGPLKMLPDLDIDTKNNHPEPDADNFGGPSDMDLDNIPKDLDDVSKSHGDQDNDGDHDMDDHDIEPKDDDEDDDEPKKEWANTPDVVEKDSDYMLNKLAGGMNSQQGTYPKVSSGDNPMQRVRENDLKASIRAELTKRLSEAKGVK